MLKEFTAYINGLLDMASSVSKKMSYSYMRADCFNLSGYKKDFLKYYKISLEKLEIVKVSESLKNIFSLFFDDDILNNLLYLIKRDTGDEVNIYTVDDSDFLDGLSCFKVGSFPFYTVEVVYLVEFWEYMICFVIGNNE
ncbi:MAG: hypothetical protein IKE75_05850 [Bacilli bacterium]|nr:hypothetical protein [Bacilli bacterium]